MRIFVDNEYRCHIADDGTMRAFDVSFFDGKCSAFIDGYRYVPEGETWTRLDGAVFTGEMIAPWKDYAMLAAAQQGYEESIEEMQDMQTALELIGVKPTEV